MLISQQLVINKSFKKSLKKILNHKSRVKWPVLVPCDEKYPIIGSTINLTRLIKAITSCVPGMCHSYWSQICRIDWSVGPASSIFVFWGFFPQCSIFTTHHLTITMFPVLANALSVSWFNLFWWCQNKDDQTALLVVNLKYMLGLEVLCWNGLLLKSMAAKCWLHS